MTTTTLGAPAELTFGDNQSRTSRALGAAINVVLLITVFAMPLLFTPLTADAINPAKQLFLLIAMTLVGVLWIARIFVTKTVVLRKSFLYFPVVLYLGAVIISAIASVDRYTSFFGGASNEYTSLVTLIGYTTMLFFMTTHESDIAFVRRAILAFFISSLVIHVANLLMLFGVAIPTLSAGSPIGSVYALAIFTTFVVLLASGMLLFDREHQAAFLPGKSGVILRITAALAALSGLAYLVLIGWWVAWLVVLIGSGLLLLFVFIYAGTFRSIGHLMMPLLTFVLALLFLLVKTPIAARVPVEVSPNQQASVQIAQNTLRDSPAFGSGPATYFADYARYRPLSLNKTVLWNVHFDRAASFALTQVATLGIVGALLWLLLIVFVAGRVVYSFIRERDPVLWMLTAILFFPWLAMIVARFLYQSTMALEFEFWFSTALLVIVTGRTARRATFSNSPRVLLGSSFAAIVFAVFMVVVLLIGTERFAAAAIFARGAHAGATPEVNLDALEHDTSRAVALDPHTDIYLRNVAHVALLRAGQTSKTEDLRTYLDAAVSAARQATVVSPVNAQNWEMLGSVYEQMAGPVRGAGELAIAALQKAQELDPKNPLYPTEIAKIHITLADALRAGKDQGKSAEEDIADHLTNALSSLTRAVTLKSDYAPAQFYSAAVFERQGKLPEAVAKMEAVVQANPRDLGAIMQMSLLYLKNNAPDKAEVQLKRALELSPNNANAHWYLASIYEARRDILGAVKEIEAVLATNPDNQAVKDRLAGLKSGRRLPPYRPIPAPL